MEITGFSGSVLDGNQHIGGGGTSGAATTRGTGCHCAHRQAGHFRQRLAHRFRQVQTCDGFADDGNAGGAGSRASGSSDAPCQRADPTIHGDPVLSSFIPFLGLFLVADTAQFQGFVVCIVRCSGHNKLPECLGDGDLRLHRLLHLVGIEDLLDAGLRVTRAQRLVAGNARDPGAGGALRATAGVADAEAAAGLGAGAVGGGHVLVGGAVGAHRIVALLALGLLAGQGAEAGTEVEAAALVVGAVVQVDGGQRTAGGKAVEPCVDGGLGAGDGAADEAGVALHADLEATVSGQDRALRAHALVVAVDLALANAGTGAAGPVADRWHTHADPEAGALLLAVVGGAVLQALDRQTAAHIDGMLRAAFRILVKTAGK